MKKYSLCGFELSDWTCQFLSVCEEIMRDDERKGIEASKELLNTIKNEESAEILKDSIAMREESLKRDLEESEIVEILDYGIGFARFYENDEMKDYAEQTLNYLGYLSKYYGEESDDEESDED